MKSKLVILAFQNNLELLIKSILLKSVPNNIELPKYNLIKTHGEQHEQIFEVECIISSINLMTNGIGKNLKTAEQKAAEKALEIFIKE